MTSITIPTLTYPLKSAISPYADVIDESVFQWAMSCALCAPDDISWYQAISVGQIVSRTYPHAPFKRQVLLGEFLLWLFSFDDKLDGYGVQGSTEKIVLTVSRLLGVLEGFSRGSLASPLEVSMAHFMRQLADHATNTQRARFVSAVTGYLFSLCWEATNRTCMIMPNLDDYQHLRYHSGAVLPCIALIDVVNDFTIDDDDYHHPDVNRLIRATANIVGWMNDVLSYNKEIFESGAVRTLPAVIQYHDNLEISRAVDKAIEIHNEEVRMYQHLDEQVRRRGSHNLCCFLDGLQYWITGNLSWSLSNGRYRIAEVVPSPATEILGSNSSSKTFASEGINGRSGIFA
jgi:hypothetical protein